MNPNERRLLGRIQYLERKLKEKQHIINGDAAVIHQWKKRANEYKEEAKRHQNNFMEMQKMYYNAAHPHWTVREAQKREAEKYAKLAEDIWMGQDDKEEQHQPLFVDLVDILD